MRARDKFGKGHLDSNSLATNPIFPVANCLHLPLKANITIVYSVPLIGPFTPHQSDWPFAGAEIASSKIHSPPSKTACSAKEPPLKITVKKGAHTPLCDLKNHIQNRCRGQTSVAAILLPTLAGINSIEAQ